MANSSVPRILLISNVPPVPSGVGGVFLRDLCELYPKGHLAFALTTGTDPAVWPAQLAGAPRTVLPAVPEHGLNTMGRQVRLRTRPIFEKYVRSTAIPRAVAHAVAFGREQRVDRVWVPLSSPTLVRLAKRVAVALQVPLLTTVWDPPRYYLGSYWGLTGGALDSVVADFDEAIAHSARCAVASRPMKLRYESQYGVDCVPMIHSPSRELWASVRPPALEGDPFVIGYAGSLYAVREWDALIEALSGLGWQVGGRPVRIRLLASAMNLRVAGPVAIEYRGWQSTADTIRLLAETDIGYIPYWFDEDHREAVELCFPNKIPTYLAARRPVLYHGPERSSPAEFLARHPVGIGLHTLDPRRIADALTAFATDPAATTTAIQAGIQALDDELSPEHFREAFAEFVGVEGSSLNPLEYSV